MPNNKIPNIRFKGFNQEWEEAKLSTKFDFDVPHNSLSRDKLNNENGEVQDIHYGDILIKYGSVVDAHKDKIPYITNSNESDYASERLADGDIIFADTAEDETAGKAIEIQNTQSNCVVAGLHTIVARPNTEFSSNYLGHCLNSASFHSKMIPLLQGIKVLSISKSTLADLSFSFPSDRSEQQKIGSFFRALDELIAAKEEELEKLRQLKAALLEQMFPQSDADTTNRGGCNVLIINQLDKSNMTISTAPNTPRIRFKGFTEPWEKSQLKKEVDYTSTGVRACDISSNGKYDLYDANDIIGKVNTYASDKPYISIIKDGAGVGRVRLLPESTNVLGTMGVISPKGENDINFIFSHIQNKDFKQHIISGAIPHVYFKNYGEDEILIPLPAEQQKIGNFFREQDEVICASADNITKLKTIKQALLQKMFAA